MNWKAMTDKKYLGSYDFLPGQEKILTIKNVRRELIKGFKNGAMFENHKPVIYFEGDNKPLICNATNGDTISNIVGSEQVEKWIGHRIQVYVANLILNNGTRTQGLRIRGFEPQNDTVSYKCSVCGKTINEAVALGSYDKYGRYLCSKECLENTKNKNKDILKG